MRPMATLLVVNVVAVPYHAVVGLAGVMGLSNARQTHEFLVGTLILFLFGSLPTLISAWVLSRRQEGVLRALAVTEVLLALVYGGATIYLLNA